MATMGQNCVTARLVHDPWLRSCETSTRTGESVVMARRMGRGPSSNGGDSRKKGLRRGKSFAQKSFFARQAWSLAWDRLPCRCDRVTAGHARSDPDGGASANAEYGVRVSKSDHDPSQQLLGRGARCDEKTISSDRAGGRVRRNLAIRWSAFRLARQLAQIAPRRPHGRHRSTPGGCGRATWVRSGPACHSPHLPARRRLGIIDAASLPTTHRRAAAG